MKIKHEIVDTWNEKTATGSMTYKALCSCGELLQDNAQVITEHLNESWNKITTEFLTEWLENFCPDCDDSVGLVCDKHSEPDTE